MIEYNEGNGKYRISGVPIMRTHKGGKYEYSEETLKKIEAAFIERKAKSMELANGGAFSALLPKLYIDHPNVASISESEKSSRTQYGKLDNVRFENNALYCDLIDVDETLVNDIKEGKYPNRSTELATDGNIIMLRGLALLPPDKQPRIPLPDMILNSASGVENIITDSDGNIVEIATLGVYLDNIIQNKIDKKVDIFNKADIMSTQDKKEETMADENKVTAEPKDYELQLNSLTNEIGEAKKLLSSYHQANEDLKKQLDSIKAESVRKDNVLILNSLESEGFVIPADDKDTWIDLLSSKEGEAKTKLIATMKNSFKKLPTQHNASDGFIDRPKPGDKTPNINPLTGKEIPADVDSYFRA